MSENKPNVFPKQGETNQVNDISEAEKLAAIEMSKRTAEQLALAEAKKNNVQPIVTQPQYQEQPKPKVVITKDYDAPYDLIPLPSEGKIYPYKKSSIKIAYLTAADENILTSPNLLASGKFLEVLFERKIIDEVYDLKNIHVGDRNAIMIWLRATGYGPKYPVTLIDPITGEQFEHEVDLQDDLQYKKLGAEPDKEGLFDFLLPLSKTPIKFKLLNVGEVEEIESMIEKEKGDGVEISNSVTYALEKQILECNGSRDRNYISDFIRKMRIADSKAFKKYIETIESGVDLTINVKTPGGGSLSTFLPLNINFFWPDLRI
jgi:hypothetical protein